MKLLDNGRIVQTIEYQPIGVLRCESKNPYEAPRQGVLAEGATGRILLNQGFSGDCLSDLSDFTHVWVIYDFHHNKNWKPKVMPPTGGQKRGVFATRSPYRPNSIGMSCVELVKIEHKQVYIQKHDILDGTPILDIKPYLNYADSFPHASLGWAKERSAYKIEVHEQAQLKIDWLMDRVNFQFEEVLIRQLEYDPLNRKTKRIKKIKNDFYVYALRTWRILVKVCRNTVEIIDVYSGYSEKEKFDSEDKYGDKALHYDFERHFGQFEESIMTDK